MKDLLGLLDLLVLPVREDWLVPLDLLDHLEDPGHRDPQAPLEKRVSPVRRVQLARPVAMESRVLLASLVLLGHQVCQERMETRVKSGNMVRKEPKEPRESMVHQVHLGPWDPLVSLVLLVPMESWDPEASRVHSELKVTKDPEVFLERQVQLDFRDFLDLQERRERPVTLALWGPPALLVPVALQDPTVLTELKDLLVVWVTLDPSVKRVSLERLDLLA